MEEQSRENVQSSEAQSEEQNQDKSTISVKFQDPEKLRKIKATLAKLLGRSPLTPKKKTNEIAELKQFQIPDQENTIKTLLDDDPSAYDFGGLMKQYYSYALKSYCLVNMQDRYRGASKHAKCYTALDVSKIGSKEQEHVKNTRRKLRKIEGQMQNLKDVAEDQDHFNYLKSLSHTQPITMPLTVLNGIVEEMIPVLEDVYRYYGKNLGLDHHVTRKAGLHYIKMRKRGEMYCKINGGTADWHINE